MTPKEAWNGLLDDIKTMKHLTNIRQKKDILDKLDILRLVLVDYEEMKKEIIARQETENSLTQWVADLTTELEELKKRDTPMKVSVNEILTKGREHKRYSCPSCDYFFGYICTTTTECNVLRDNFCHHCGQRLDWNNESKVGTEE